ncbi:MAG: DUF1761 domain-containing protein [Arenicella sp.]
MGEITNNVSWIGVIVGAVVAFLLGWAWYSPKLFGTKWAEGVGVKLDGAGPSALAMIVQILGTFLLAWVIGVTAATESLLTAILFILTVVSLFVASGLFCQKSRYAIATETGFIVAMSVIMIICQGVF